MYLFWTSLSWIITAYETSSFLNDTMDLAVSFAAWGEHFDYYNVGYMFGKMIKIFYQLNQYGVITWFRSAHFKESQIDIHGF